MRSKTPFFCRAISDSIFLLSMTPFFFRVPMNVLYERLCGFSAALMRIFHNRLKSPFFFLRCANA